MKMKIKYFIPLLFVPLLIVFLWFRPNVKIAYLVLFKKTGEINQYNAKGLLDGECLGYINGKLCAKSYWKNGLREGQVLTFYKSGQLERKTFYKNDERNGIECEYYENGRINYLVTWRENKRFGSEYHYLNNGLLSVYDAFDIDNVFFYGKYDESGRIKQCIGNVISPNIYSTNNRDSTLLLNNDSSYTSIRDLYINYASPPNLKLMVRVRINGRELNKLDSSKNVIKISNVFSKVGKTLIAVEGKLMDNKNKLIKTDSIKTIINRAP